MTLSPTDDDRKKVAELINAGARLCSAEAFVVLAETEAARSRVLLKRLRLILELIGHNNSLEEAWQQICLGVLQGRKEDLSRPFIPLGDDPTTDTVAYRSNLSTAGERPSGCPASSRQSGTPHDEYRCETSTCPAGCPLITMRQNSPAIPSGNALRHPAKRMAPTAMATETKRTRV
jgi:hypothetical protein